MGPVSNAPLPYSAGGLLHGLNLRLVLFRAGDILLCSVQITVFLLRNCAHLCSNQLIYFRTGAGIVNGIYLVD